MGMQNGIDDSLHLEDSLIVSQNVNIELPYDHQFHSNTTAYTTKFHNTQQKKFKKQEHCAIQNTTAEKKSRHIAFSSVAQSCPILCDPVDCRMPGLPVHYQLPEFTQTHVH